MNNEADKVSLDLLKEDIDSIVMSFLPKKEGYPKVVLEAMEYAVSAGGKRIRPMIMYLTFKALGGTDMSVLKPFMAAIEMIHTYSLIHDDLPALDNDELRRGRPTVHVKFGEDMAILAGDALLNYAYETVSKAFSIAPGSVAVEKAFACIARKPGIYGMIGGQTLDVLLTGKKINSEELEYIYANKTAALLECSMMVGAYLAGASDEIVELIRQCAYEVGMAFQVQDDILDIIGDEKLLGKPIGSDEKNDKYTYATIFGIDKAREYVKDATDKSIAILAEIKAREDIKDKISEKYLITLEGLLLSLVTRNN